MRRLFVMMLQVQFVVHVNLDYTECGYGRLGNCMTNILSEVMSAVTSNAASTDPSDPSSPPSLLGIIAEIAHDRDPNSELADWDSMGIAADESASALNAVEPIGEGYRQPSGVPTSMPMEAADDDDEKDNSDDAFNVDIPVDTEVLYNVAYGFGVLFFIYFIYSYCIKSSPNKRKIYIMTREKDVDFAGVEYKDDSDDDGYQYMSEDESEDDAGNFMEPYRG